ncbi:hypothetical protein [Streptomyces sp. NPDC051001]|uniref:hypothetical protein n=1 Tax=Streptomyces sp. NPDC051001 TaxID=3155795 RepID=UPI003443F752
MRVLLPVARGLAGLAPGVGGPLLGALLLRCLTPGWVLLRPSPPARLLAWAEEAVAVARRAHPSRPVRLARALALHAHALDALGRHEEACAVVADAVPGAGLSQAQTAFVEAEFATIRSVLADALRAGAVVADVDAKVTALRSLLALTRRADATDVHASCVRAFAQARTDRAVRAWERATGEPYPTFVYRPTTERGRGSNPAAR